jgi:hypothetical protein
VDVWVGLNNDVNCCTEKIQFSICQEFLQSYRNESLYCGMWARWHGAISDAN